MINWCYMFKALSELSIKADSSLAGFMHKRTFYSPTSVLLELCFFSKASGFAHGPTEVGGVALTFKQPHRGSKPFPGTEQHVLTEDNINGCPVNLHL